MKNDHLWLRGFIWVYLLQNKQNSRQAWFCLIRKYQRIYSVSFTIALLREHENSFALELLIVFSVTSSSPSPYSLKLNLLSQFLSPFCSFVSRVQHRSCVCWRLQAGSRSLIERNHQPAAAYCCCCCYCCSSESATWRESCMWIPLQLVVFLETKLLVVNEYRICIAVVSVSVCLSAVVSASVEQFPCCFLRKKTIFIQYQGVCKL